MTSPIKTDADLFFDETPSLWPAYLRAPFKKNTLRNGQDLPRLTGIWKNIQFDPAHVNRYRACCGLSEEPAIPWTYPYLFIARLQLRMLTHPAFPLTPLGALHCRNTIVCRETLDPQQTWTAETGFLPSRRVKQGLEIRMDGRLRNDRITPWCCESAYLVRSRRLAGDEETPPEFRFEPVDKADTEFTWFVPAGTGRAYARISGDWNPIHLSDLSARIFGGFPKSVVHGMWSLARCLAGLPASALRPPFRLDAAFKGPVFMPGSCRAAGKTDGAVTRLDVFCGDNPRPVLQMRISPADDR